MFLVQMRSLYGNAFKFPVFKKALLRLLGLILILSLAWLWVLLAAKPALAQDNPALPISQSNFKTNGRDVALQRLYPKIHTSNQQRRQSH